MDSASPLLATLEACEAAMLAASAAKEEDTNAAAASTAASTALARDVQTIERLVCTDETDRGVPSPYISQWEGHRL